MAWSHWGIFFLALVAVWIFLNAMDDLFIVLAFLLGKRNSFRWPKNSELAHCPQRRIAIFVPLWHEHEV
ncbi:MAG: hypothetical protein JO099_14940, partial [Acidobacteriia bacterium]|nr:hypothetical protein [Terriglobia bacterium]